MNAANQDGYNMTICNYKNVTRIEMNSRQEGARGRQS